MNSPVLTVIDHLIAEQEKRHAWLFKAGEQMRINQSPTERDGGRANNAPPTNDE